MSRLDALFLHAPRKDGPRREVMVLPLGIPALANLLADEGRSVEIVHLGIAEEVAPQFSLRELLAQTKPRMVCVPLHFNPQTRAAIDTVRMVRACAKDAHIVMGGLTATVFAEELVSLGLADVVVRGDGEMPLLGLADALLDGKGTLVEVPNLTYREGDSVRVSDPLWTLDPDFAGRLRHADLSRLRDRDSYLSRALYADFSEGAEGSAGYPYAAYLNAGRGCTADCIYCGGARSAQITYTKRNHLVLYPIGKLTRDVHDAVAHGARVIRTCFDPPESRPHQMDWFARIRSEGIRLRSIFDFWAPGSTTFLTEFAKTFAPESVAVFSPDCGSEAVRRRVRGYAYSNAQLVRSIEEAQGLGLKVHLFFGAGLPTETKEDIEETVRLIREIRTRTGAAVSVTPMFIDPGNAIWRDPVRFGVRLKRRTLRDFYEEQGVRSGSGFDTEYFTEEQALRACEQLLEAAGIRQ